MKSQKLVHYWGGIAENPKSFNMVECGELLCLSEANVNFSIYSHQWPIRPPCHPLKLGHTESEVWPSMTRTRNLCSSFNPSNCTHSSEHTHTEQWQAMPVAPGDQMGVRCLAQGSHLSCGIEGGENAGYSLPPPTIPAGPETRTHDLRVKSQTFYPLGHTQSISQSKVYFLYKSLPNIEFIV